MFFQPKKIQNKKIKIDRDTYIEREKSELVNDRNDRAILLACKWYAKHLESKKIEVVLLTEDEESFQNEQNNELKIVTGNLLDFSFLEFFLKNHFCNI